MGDDADDLPESASSASAPRKSKAKTKRRSRSRVPGITPQQADAVRLVASGMAVAEAARKVGVSPRTVFEWRSKPWWDRAEELAAARLRREAAAKLDRLRPVALDALGSLLKLAVDKPKAVPATESVRAAMAILAESRPTTSETVHRQLQALLRERLEAAGRAVLALESRIGREAVDLVIDALAGELSTETTQDEGDGQEGEESAREAPL